MPPADAARAEARALHGRLHGRARLWMALGGVLLALAALVDVTVTNPQVTVRWRADTGGEDRVALERRYGLQNGEPDKNSPETWQYTLGDRSRENIRALVGDPAVADTGYIDRDALTPRRRGVRVAMRPLPFPFRADGQFEDPRQLFQLQSLCLLLAGGVMLWAARATGAHRRRNVAAAALLLVGAMAFAFPVSPSLVRMGDANQVVRSRPDFEAYAGVHGVRFEAHLSYAVLGQLDRLFGRTDEAPARAQVALAHGVTAWFVVSALAIGFLEHWSPFVLRYLGLALLAPSALLYFGWREVGYLALNLAAFPLMARGLAGGATRLEAGSVVAGLGAALHGFGLISLAGACLAALAARARPAVRLARTLHVAAWGTAAYLGWIAVYVIVLKLPITLGHAESLPWRPWRLDTVVDGRMNPAILGATGARDLLMTGWVVGAPLLVVAASLWRRYGEETRVALWYSLPSVVFVILFWPIQGLAEEMDLVVAAFPAVYALAWVCAHDPKQTRIAAALLLSAHLAFWRILLDTQFINRVL